MKINWKDHLVNLIVVILGITIAFWLNNWAESSKAKKQERVYLESLLKDIKDDIYEIEYIKNYSESQISSINRLVSFSVGRPVPKDSIMNDIFKIQYSLSFTPQNVTYESLTSSGKLDLIREFDMRNQMLELYNQYYGRMNLWDVSCNQHIDNFIKPVVMKNLEVTGRNQIKTDMIRSQEFKNALFAQQYLLQQRQGFIAIMQTATDSLETNITRYLEEGN